MYNSAFLKHFVFYGSSKDDVSIDEDAVEFLNSEETRSWSFIKAHQANNLPVSGLVLLVVV